MHTLAIDIETYSTQPLAKTGAYKYAAHPSFEILLFAYSVDQQPVTVIDLANRETIPPDILHALSDPGVEKWAFNAQFERVCLSYYLQHHHGHEAMLRPEGWYCSMVWASAIGLPTSLKHAGAALNLQAQKHATGTRLIKLFCEPRKPTKTQAQPSLLSAERNTRATHPKQWEEFKAYNLRDVETENQLRARLRGLELPAHVWEEYWVDQRINDRGIRIDDQLVTQAQQADTHHTSRLLREAKQLTGVENPGSAIQLKQWLATQGVELPSLTKLEVDKALTTTTGTPRRVLEIRQQLAKSSTKKYAAMDDCMIETTHRAHGLIQFYGAGRTGRWAGRLIQVQNLPRNYMPDLDTARQLIRDGDHDLAHLIYPSLPGVLSELIRTAFIPTPGNRFLVADYSAIEARVLAWLAGQASTLNAFERGEDLYCATASNMFGVPVEKHGPNSELRQKGKIAVLACGYGGGVGALEAMGAKRMGIPEDELPMIVDAWRAANPHVVAYWRGIQDTAIDTITTRTPHTHKGISMRIHRGILQLRLPSGRYLSYPKPSIGTNRFGGPSITFQSMGANKQLTQLETYGGRLVENITQAVARDLLAHALTQLEAEHIPVVMHIHDEVVVDAPPTISLDQVVEAMTRLPDWAQGLPLTADGYECDYYQKDN